MLDNQILQISKINLQLDKIQEYPLTLVTAPAGSGKSTLVRDYLERNKKNYLWIDICIDEDDCEHILNIALNQIFAQNIELGRKFNQLNASRNKLTVYSLLQLGSEYLKENKTIVVIDNYEHIKNKNIDDLIERLIRYGFEGVHLILVSRTMPPIHSEELELKNLCQHIEKVDFVMSCDDVSSFFKSFQMELVDSNIEKAANMSEGWITGAKMLLEHYTKTGNIEFDSDSDKLVKEMIIDSCSIKSRWIMETIALFGEVSLDFILCLADFKLTGKEALNIIEDSGFILYKQDSDTFRLHGVLENYYERNRLIDTSDLNYKDLYSKAGNWYFQENEIIKGLRYIYLAGDFNEFMKVFERSMSIVLLNNNSDFIVDSFEKIPMYVKLSFPFAYLYYIDFYLTNINLLKGKALVENLENHVNRENDWSDELNRQFQGELSIVKSYLEFNDFRKMHGYQETAYRLIGSHSLSVCKHKHCSLGSVHLSYMYYNKKGIYKEISDYVTLNYKTYELITDNCCAGFKDIFNAEYLFETGEYLAAIEECKKGKFRAQEYTQKDIILCSNFLDARINFSEGRICEGRKLREKIIQDRFSFCCPIMKDAYDIAIGYTGYLIGNQKYTAEWLKKMDYEKCHISFEGIGYSYIVGGMILLMNREYVKLEAFTDDMLMKFDRYNNIIGYIHCHILDAIAKFNLSHFYKAEIALTMALDYARYDSVIQPFVEYSNDLLQMMEVYLTRHKDDSFVVKIVEAMRRYKRNILKSNNKRITIDRLTTREDEVLKLIVEGKTNKEIAQSLHLAEITIKKHASAIYRKLEVCNRSQAIKKYFELKVL